MSRDVITIIAEDKINKLISFCRNDENLLQKHKGI